VEKLVFQDEIWENSELRSFLSNCCYLSRNRRLRAQRGKEPKATQSFPNTSELFSEPILKYNNKGKITCNMALTRSSRFNENLDVVKCRLRAKRSGQTKQNRVRAVSFSDLRAKRSGEDKEAKLTQS
jgi:hypothetical protein